MRIETRTGKPLTLAQAVFQSRIEAEILFVLAVVVGDPQARRWVAELLRPR